MSDLIITGQEKKDSNSQEQIEINYKATESDEERFFLMYHMNFQPSEVAALSDDYRRWLIARYIGQKNMEREAMKQHQLMQSLGPDLKSGSPGLNLVR